MNYTSMGIAELRAEAGRRILKSDGSTGQGAGLWRAGATKDALIAALNANDAGVILDGAPSGAPSHAPSKADMLAALLREMSEPVLDEGRIRDIVRETMTEHGALRVEVALPTGETKDVGRVHASFPKLLAWCAMRRPVWLVGPAGSGKTMAAHAVATALNLPFYAISVGPQTTQSRVEGFIDAQSVYREPLFRTAYQNGGVFLFDEADAGSAGVWTALNQALANGHAAFPDGMVQCHNDFVPIACGNTYGMGANRVYVGRAQLDGATLDRFAFLDWPIDEAFERDLAIARATAVGRPDVAGPWVSQVQTWRNKADAVGIRHIISPRASIYGAEALARGIAREDVEASLVWRGLDADAVRKVKS